LESSVGLNDSGEVKAAWGYFLSATEVVTFSGGAGTL
jgi:hypothetical protein